MTAADPTATPPGSRRSPGSPACAGSGCCSSAWSPRSARSRRRSRTGPPRPAPRPTGCPAGCRTAPVCGSTSGRAPRAGTPGRIVRRARAPGLARSTCAPGPSRAASTVRPVLDRAAARDPGHRPRRRGLGLPAARRRRGRRRPAGRRRRCTVPPGSGTPLVRAVAPDIETAAEGTAISAAAVTAYLTELRRLLPAGRADPHDRALAVGEPRHLPLPRRGRGQRRRCSRRPTGTAATRRS